MILLGKPKKERILNEKVLPFFIVIKSNKESPLSST